MTGILNLRDARCKHQLTQVALAERCGLYPYNISTIERGRHRPNAETKRKIEAAIGHIDWIATERIEARTENYIRAERLLKRLIEISITLSEQQYERLRTLIAKHYKLKLK